jgi:transcription initiation factor TFIIE subunit alpha
VLQSAKNAKAHNAAAANDGQPIAKEGEEKVKLHTHSYCCLDYAQVSLLKPEPFSYYFYR